MDRKSLRQTVVLFLTTLTLCLAVHFWLTDRKGVLRAFYPVPAIFSELTIICNKEAPEWLEEMMEEGVWGLRSLSSQLAYISSEGELHHCEGGWQQRSFFSDRVSKDSRFRYGSLTKPITSAAALILAKEKKLFLDAPLFEIFAEDSIKEALLTHQKPAVTVAQLMRHESGLVEEVFVEKKKPWCPYDMEKLGDTKVHAVKPGEHKYSNLGYCVLGEIVAQQYRGGYRNAMNEMFDLGARGINFAKYHESQDEVWHDYRYHDFYRPDIKPEFDYYAISSAAGMTGSAKAYALLMRDILARNIPAFLGGEAEGCDVSRIRECYGNAFYRYRANNGESFNIKEGYMPGAVGVVVINDSAEVFVWLGNSDTLKASSGKRMTAFVEALSYSQF